MRTALASPRTTWAQKRAVLTGFGLILTTFALMLVLDIPSRRMNRLLRGDEPRLLHRDAAGWRQIDLPGIPYEIQTGIGGEVWVATYMGDGLSRWSGGKWTHWGSVHHPSGGFAVAGSQVWVSNEGGIERFDGQTWHKLAVSIPDPMATAAQGDDVWAINASGLLAHCARDTCDTHSVADQIPDSAWKSHILGQGSRRADNGRRKLGARSLAWAEGRLWFIDHAAWYSTDGRTWIEWQGSDYKVWLAGVSGDRLWFRTRDFLFGVGEDLQATSFPLYPLTFLFQAQATDGRLKVASGDQGLVEYADGAWHPVSIDARLHAKRVTSFAVAPDGEMWVVGVKPPSPVKAIGTGVAVVVILMGWVFAAQRQAARASL
jgi:hypothetical protein